MTGVTEKTWLSTLRAERDRRMAENDGVGDARSRGKAAYQDYETVDSILDDIRFRRSDIRSLPDFVLEDLIGCMSARIATTDTPTDRFFVLVGASIRNQARAGVFHSTHFWLQLLLDDNADAVLADVRRLSDKAA
ncbi:hypothetical protein [Tateyamaria sp. Alg231-49]|uniref:hypothetical protein n=1 Tax=Tateyamaria sp. Alg231-49 TaxID=1922219 RepID=UPI000D54CD03|nr:hypothetical protein [Tateyamaria sp. Alg231-49]